ncbi:hypothetical protein QTO34_006999, partial [Cnephaeus nilssonii]
MLLTEQQKALLMKRKTLLPKGIDPRSHLTLRSRQYVCHHHQPHESSPRVVHAAAGVAPEASPPDSKRTVGKPTAYDATEDRSPRLCPPFASLLSPISATEAKAQNSFMALQ